MDFLDEWPSSPPEPTDADQRVSASQLPVRLCPYCDEEIHQREVESSTPYVDHVYSCEVAEKCVDVSFPNGLFGIVVPENTGYVWSNKVGGFACQNVVVQGTLIPLDTPRTFEDRRKRADLRERLEGRFEAFDDPEAALRAYLRGRAADPLDDFGGADLGEKLVAEQLDGVYADEEEVRERKLETRPERVNAAWDEINENLPFSYERAVAPRGRPLTREGIRWINIQGLRGIYAEDGRLGARYTWVEALAERDEPVALFYPNSD